MGARLESTAYGGFDYPTDERRAGVHPPRFYGALVTGYASRTIDAWVGGLYRRYVTPSGETADHPGDLAMYSVVFGYRLAPFRKDRPTFRAWPRCARWGARPLSSRERLSDAPSRAHDAP